MAVIIFTARSGESVTFAGSPSELDSPADNVGFGFRSNDDWYAASDSKTPIDERPVADGAFGILRDWRSSLPLSIPGWYKGADRAGVRAARRKLQRVLANGATVNIRFVDEDEDTSREISVRSMVPTANSGLFFRIALDAVALDPNAYGVEEIFITGVAVSGGGLLFPLGTTPTAYWDFGADGTTGRVTVTNDGTTETYPTLEVTGGLSGGFVITDVTTGEVVRFARAIPVGSSVVINQRTGAATIDGQSDVSGFITSFGFFSIGPGETHVIQFAPIGATTGTPTFKLTSQDGYL